jgi:hypothetical protein
VTPTAKLIGQIVAVVAADGSSSRCRLMTALALPTSASPLASRTRAMGRSRRTPRVAVLRDRSSRWPLPLPSRRVSLSAQRGRRSWPRAASSRTLRFDASTSVPPCAALTAVLASIEPARLRRNRKARLVRNWEKKRSSLYRAREGTRTKTMLVVVVGLVKAMC